MTRSTAQLSFDDIFAAEARDLATKHLPGDIERAIPFYRGLIKNFNAALLKPDYRAAEEIQKEADDLACKLNGGELLGINGGEGSPVDQLEKGTAASTGTVPLWG